MKRTLRPACLVVALLGMGAQAAQAQTYLTQAQASISNFSYSLVDLDLTDGVASSIAFQGPSNHGLSIAAGAPIYSDFYEFMGGPPPFNPFGSNNYSLSSPTGSATVVLDGANITSTAKIDASDAMQAFSTGYMVTSGVTNWPSPPGYFSEEDFANLSNFVLAPHTSFVIEGTLDFQLQVNGQALDSALLSSITEAGRNVRAETFGSANFHLELQNGAYDARNIYAEQYVVQDALNAYYGGYSEIQGPTTFKLVVHNDTGDYLKGIFTYGVGATGTVLMSPGVPQVPEPGTLALHVLGLLGLAAAVSRHARKDRT